MQNKVFVIVRLQHASGKEPASTHFNRERIVDFQLNTFRKLQLNIAIPTNAMLGVVLTNFINFPIERTTRRRYFRSTLWALKFNSRDNPFGRFHLIPLESSCVRQ
jgi:hypothetical protein